MKVISFNANGIRARQHQLAALKEAHDPDVIGIQETKVQDADFPVEMIAELGYQAYFHGQKGHYGVALLFKRAPLAVEKGFPCDGEDAQRRVLAAICRTPEGEEVKVINAYFPQGESRDHPTKFSHKRQFYADMLNYLRDCFSPHERLILMGDMNVAPLDSDIGIGADNAKRWLRTGKCSFLPEERDWLQALMDWGLSDTFRKIHPDVEDRFSWFDYRSRGFERDPKRGLRIDLLLATAALCDSCNHAGIAYDIRGMEKPSDHCPIWANFEI